MKYLIAIIVFLITSVISRFVLIAILAPIFEVHYGEKVYSAMQNTYKVLCISVGLNAGFISIILYSSYRTISNSRTISPSFKGADKM
jgi:hypothetical protein